MNILSIDSSSKQISIALKKDDQIFNLESKQETRASQVVLEMIDSILKENSIECKDLNILTFNKGPASFTGTRIAASIVQAIGYSWKIPVFGVSSLTLMAYAHHQSSDYSQIISIKKAYSKKIYWASYDIKKNSYKPIDGNHISEFSNIKFDKNYQWHGLSDCWGDYDAGTNELIDQHVECIHSKEETGAKKIIEFIIDNENLEKSFSYKDTLPDYVNYDLFD